MISQPNLVKLEVDDLIKKCIIFFSGETEEFARVYLHHNDKIVTEYILQTIDDTKYINLCFYWHTLSFDDICKQVYEPDLRLKLSVSQLKTAIMAFFGIRNDISIKVRFTPITGTAKILDHILYSEILDKKQNKTC